VSHFTLHWLLEQTAVASGFVGQILPQPPQFAASVLVSTQAPPHSMAGNTQAKSQLPSTHVGVAPGGGMHTVSQSPQCAVLVIKSMQDPSQFWVPPAQPVPHFPPAQTCVPLQAVAQSPQWAPSDAKSTHWPLQFW
jgi:hypothetical protein